MDGNYKQYECPICKTIYYDYDGIVRCRKIHLENKLKNRKQSTMENFN